MKKFLLLFFVVATVNLNAQQTDSNKPNIVRENPRHIDGENTSYTGAETLQGEIRPDIREQYQSQTAQTHAPDGKEEWMGDTRYDLQTNGTSQNRISIDAEDNAKVVWTFHQNTTNTGFPNRGTGFNESIGADNFINPIENISRIESVRTGWPSIGTLDDGTDVAVSHFPGGLDGVIDLLVMMKRAPGASTWTESYIPTNTGKGLLWPRIAVTGQTIHMIAVTTPVANDGTPYQGLDPALLYFRSQDAGANWDIQDFLFPSLDSTVIEGVNADSYVLECDDAGNVAIGTFGVFDDVTIIKSTDGGTSWTPTIINDFPFPMFAGGFIDYTLDDIGGFDPEGPGSIFTGLTNIDSLAFLTNEGTGSLTIDAEGRVHAVFVTRYMTSADPTLEPGFFQPYSYPVGLQYWNESYGVDSTARIDAVENHFYVFDNDTLFLPEISVNTPDEVADYGGNAMITMPTISVSDDGKLVVAYMKVMEEFVREDELNTNPRQHYNHIHMSGSADCGLTWSDPYDVINNDVVFLPPLIPSMETSFPTLEHIAGDRFALQFMWDDEPGLNLIEAEMDGINVNTLSFVRFDAVEMLGVPTEVGGCIALSTETVAPAALGFAVAPNPAHSTAFVNFTLEEAATVSLTVSNIVGQQISSENLSRLPAGYQNHEINVNGFTPGMYLVTLRVDDRVATQKLVVNAN